MTPSVVGLEVTKVRRKQVPTMPGNETPPLSDTTDNGGTA